MRLCQVLYIMYRIRPDRSLKNLNLCNAEIEEVVDLMKIARARVIRVHGEGTQGLDPGLGNRDRIPKKEGWKDSWWYTSDEQAPPKAWPKQACLLLKLRQSFLFRICGCQCLLGGKSDVALLLLRGPWAHRYENGSSGRWQMAWLS